MNLPAISSRGMYALAAYRGPGVVPRAGAAGAVGDAVGVRVLEPWSPDTEPPPGLFVEIGGRTLGRFVDTWA